MSDQQNIPKILEELAATIDTDRLNKIDQIQAKLLSANFNLDDFMNLVVEQMLTLTPATGAVIELADGGDVVYRAATGSVKGGIGMRMAMQGSISGLCIASREVLMSNDTEIDKRVNLEACRKVQARSLVVAPLFHEGKSVGVLKILSKDPDAFDNTDIKILQTMAAFLGSALSRQILNEIRRFL